MNTTRTVAAFEIDLGVAGQEKNLPRAVLRGERFRVTAKLLAGSWGAATLSIKARSGTAAPANFSSAMALSASATSYTLGVSDESPFDELCLVQSGTSSGGLVRVEVVEEVLAEAERAGLRPDVQSFTASGTWTKPQGSPRFVRVQMGGGGGGGGAGRRGATSSLRNGGGGGNGGAIQEFWLPASAIGITQAVVVGTGGAGASANTSDNTSGGNGSNGVDSSFAGYVAKGGTGGLGGTGATLTANAQTLGMFPGGIGAVSATAPNASTGGGGGGCGGGFSATNIAVVSSSGGSAGGDATVGGAGGATTVNGSSGGDATLAYFPGAGGGGGGSNGGAGGAGGVPCGGGGGSGAATNGTATGAGGDGKRGFVIVTTYF